MRARALAHEYTYDIINARVRLSRCLYSRRYYETPSENVLRFVSPFILFCFNRMGGTKPGHTHTHTHDVASRTCTHTHALGGKNVESSSRVTFAFFLSRAESSTRGTLCWKKFQLRSNSSARYKQGFLMLLHRSLEP